MAIQCSIGGVTYGSARLFLGHDRDRSLPIRMYNELLTLDNPLGAALRSGICGASFFEMLIKTLHPNCSLAGGAFHEATLERVVRSGRTPPRLYVHHGDHQSRRGMLSHGGHRDI